MRMTTPSLLRDKIIRNLRQVRPFTESEIENMQVLLNGPAT